MHYLRIYLAFSIIICYDILSFIRMHAQIVTFFVRKKVETNIFRSLYHYIIQNINQINEM